MSNFILNNYCNLQCPYCFAEDITYDTAKEMSVETFKEILSFILRTDRVDRIGLVGGEPTLHSKFKEILKEVALFTKYYEAPSKLYTNGIYLNDYLNMLPKDMDVLVNTNTPKVIGVHKYDMILKSIKNAKEMGMFDGMNENNNKVRLGCNIYPSNTDYSYIFNTLKEFDIHELRMSVVSPFTDMKRYRSAEGKERYFNELKPLFIQFCKDAIDSEVKLCADCNQIPPCYFDDDELKIINKAVKPSYEHTYCAPVIDFHADMTVTNCHGWNTKPISMYEFKNINEIYRYFEAKQCPPIVTKNLDNDRCKDCKYGKLGKCCGGCPAFVSFEENETI